jgi:hypothetical protein
MADAISYLAVIASLLAMKITPRMVRATNDANIFQQLREGWTYAVRFAPIRNVLLLLALVSLVGMPYTVLMPVFANEVLHGGPSTLGLLMPRQGWAHSWGRYFWRRGKPCWALANSFL